MLPKYPALVLFYTSPCCSVLEHYKQSTVILKTIICYNFLHVLLWRWERRGTENPANQGEYYCVVHVTELQKGY